MSHLKCLSGAALLAAVSAACGGGSTLPGTSSAASVQASGMNQTFAGQNKCNPKNHNRPFIVEWDATDASSFESRAANDVIVVRYDGCELTVLESCTYDAVKGSFGSYKPVEWTSGALESLDIDNEGELYAKLPLGAASLGGRVQGGEKFHMEYYVSGTRTATRDAVYRAELDKVPGCKGATHFVYGYNLGAFALGAQSKIKGQVGGSAWGFGAGANRSSSQKADKRGGDLAACRSDSAKEVQGCRAPIRLTLRDVSEGANPDAQDAQAAETPAAMNLAGKLEARMNQNERAGAFWNTARERLNARDGAGCVAALDKRDKADPKPGNLSTNVSSPAAFMRADCVMLAGKCDAGKAQLRKALLAQQASLGPEMVDSFVDNQAGQFCQGASMSPRDQLNKAWMELSQGATTKKDPAVCARDLETVKRLSATVKPNGDDDYAVKSASEPMSQAATASSCFARAGDCDAAFKAWKDWQVAIGTTAQTPGDELFNFGRSATSCKAWVDGHTQSPRDQLVKANTELATARDSASCKKAYDTVKQLSRTVKPDPSDFVASGAANSLGQVSAGTMCFARVRDCATAWATYQEMKTAVPSYASFSEAQMRQYFLAMAPSCK